MITQAHGYVHTRSDNPPNGDEPGPELPLIAPPAEPPPGTAASTTRRRPRPPTIPTSTAAPVAHCLAAQGDSRSPTDPRRLVPPPSAPQPAMPWPPVRARRRRSPGRRARAVRPVGRDRLQPTAAPSLRTRPA